MTLPYKNLTRPVAPPAPARPTVGPVPTLDNDFSKNEEEVDSVPDHNAPIPWPPAQAVTKNPMRQK